MQHHVRIFSSLPFKVKNLCKYEAEIVSVKFYVRRKHLTFPICWWSFVVCDECREHTNRSAPLFRILHSAKYQLLWPAASTQSAAEADELKYLQHTDQVIMSVLEQLQSLSREELIIFLSVIVGSIILVTIIITILCVYCCRRANRSRGEKVLPSFCFLYIFCSWMVRRWQARSHNYGWLDKCQRICWSRFHYENVQIILILYT